MHPNTLLNWEERGLLQTRRDHRGWRVYGREEPRSSHGAGRAYPAGRQRALANVASRRKPGADPSTGARLERARQLLRVVEDAHAAYEARRRPGTGDGVEHATRAALLPSLRAALDELEAGSATAGSVWVVEATPERPLPRGRYLSAEEARAEEATEAALAGRLEIDAETPGRDARAPGARPRSPGAGSASRAVADTTRHARGHGGVARGRRGGTLRAGYRARDAGVGTYPGRAPPPGTRGRERHRHAESCRG